MRDAPLLAKQIATIDVLTKGRLIIGVGVSDSYDLPEYTNLGKAERFPDRGAYLDESIALWRHLWSGSPEPFHGRFFQIDDFSFAPLPVQGRDLPIWCGGRSARAVRRAVGLTNGWHGAQTGPHDMVERIPDIIAVAQELDRPLPTLSVRCASAYSTSSWSLKHMTLTSSSAICDISMSRWSAKCKSNLRRTREP
jgi:alkanesulfonate monooxygenase SsuD/methylene tetrahydromethanopterin reductase-like flavin-dependent oxidoreductase (luciferase family)